MSRRRPLHMIIALPPWRMPEGALSDVEQLEAALIADLDDRTGWRALRDRLHEEGLEGWQARCRICHLRDTARAWRHQRRAIGELLGDNLRGMTLRTLAAGPAAKHEELMSIYVLPGRLDRTMIPEGETGPYRVVGPAIVVGAKTVLMWAATCSLMG